MSALKMIDFVVSFFKSRVFSIGLTLVLKKETTKSTKNEDILNIIDLLIMIVYPERHTEDFKWRSAGHVGILLILYVQLSLKGVPS